MTASSWNVWTIIIAFFIWYGTIMAFQGLWASPWLINVYGLTKSEAGSIISLVALGMVFGCPLSGIIADKVLKSKWKVVVLGLICSILVWLPMVFMVDSLSKGAISVMMFLYGFFNGWFVVMYGNLKENVEPAVQGTATGFLNTFVFVGGATFQQITSIIIAKAPVVNKIIASSGFRSAFMFCLIALVVGCGDNVYPEETPKSLINKIYLKEGNQCTTKLCHLVRPADLIKDGMMLAIGGNGMHRTRRYSPWP